MSCKKSFITIMSSLFLAVFAYGDHCADTLSHSGSLSPTDYVGISFWLATAIMLAATVFFFVERDRAQGKWKTSLTIAGLVTGIAFWHYLYMRNVWVDTGTSPTVFRYIDWLITVPLQIVEFYLILAAVTVVSVRVFWKLLVASLVMLVGGYLGETQLLGVSEFVYSCATYANSAATIHDSTVAFLPQFSPSGIFPAPTFVSYFLIIVFAVVLSSPTYRHCKTPF